MARASAPRKRLTPTKAAAPTKVVEPVVEPIAEDLVDDSVEGIATADDTTVPEPTVETIEETAEINVEAPAVGDSTDIPDTIPETVETVVETPVPAKDSKRLTEADLLASEYRQFYQKLLDDSGVVPPVGQLLFPNEPLTFTTSEVHRDYIVLTEDVYRMVVPFRSRRPTFTLVALAGLRIDEPQIVSKADYARLTEALLNPSE